MADKVAVTLDCRNFRTPPGQGYTNVQGSNNKPYSYRYTGGTDTNGNVTVKKGKPTDITVTIQADPRYYVDSIAVSNDPKGNISKTKGDKTATLADSAADEEHDIYYQVTVKDTTANATFVADPRIDNVK